MTHANLKSKLNAHATTAGITLFHYGYLDEFDSDNREGVYPAMVIIPINRPLKRSVDEQVQAEVEVYIMASYTREGATSRETAWDSCDTKMISFVTAVNGSSDFTIIDSNSIKSELYPFGLSTDSVVAVKYTFNMNIHC